MLKNSALETLYGGQFTPPTQLIKTNDPSLSACLSVCLSLPACLSILCQSIQSTSTCLPFISLFPTIYYILLLLFLPFIQFPIILLTLVQGPLFLKTLYQKQCSLLFLWLSCAKTPREKHRLINYSKLSSGKVWNNTNDDLLLNQSR